MLPWPVWKAKSMKSNRQMQMVRYVFEVCHALPAGPDASGSADHRFQGFQVGRIDRIIILWTAEDRGSIRSHNKLAKKIPLYRTV